MRWVNQSAERFQQALATGISPDPRMQELVAVARAFPVAAAVLPGPRPEFVAALRERLMEQAAAMPVQTSAARPAPRTARPTTPAGNKVINIGMGAVRKGLVGAAAAGLVVGGVGLASRGAVPGSALYPVKQLLDDAAVNLADPGYARGMTYLAQAQEHIGDTRTLVSSSPVAGSDVSFALTEATNAVTAARTEFAAGYAATKGEQNLLALPDFSSRALPQIDALEPSIPADAKAQWQTLRDLVAQFAKPTSQTLPGVPGSTGGTGGALPGTTTTSTSPSTSSPTGSAGAPTSGSSGSAGPGLPSVPVTSAPNLPLPTTPPKPSLPGITLPPVTIAPTGLPISPTIVVSVPPTLPAPGTLAEGDLVKILSTGATGRILDIRGSLAQVQVTVAGQTTVLTIPLAGLIKL